MCDGEVYRVSGSQREGFRVEGGQVEGQVYEVFQIPKSKA